MKPPVADRYRLDEVIAAGGMGTVWRGHDLRLDRPVAVKLLRDTAFQDAEGARRRFEREARAAARLRGPGFAEVYDHGETVLDGEKLAYLVMELVEGESLTALLRREGPLVPDRAMEITAVVAQTLQTVHDEGIVHRDIKPGNILINLDGEVKLVDFGIARINDATSLTSTGIALGTLSHASPEQLDMGELTSRTDIYSLGTVAYQCLAGRPPFDSADRAAVIAAHLNAEPPPLPDHVPDLVAHVVLVALEKDPRDRWGSAQEFAAACRDAASGDRTVLTRRTRSRRAGPRGMWSWRGGFVAMAVAAALLLTATLVWSPLTG
ncbi:serine/threonine-protein kinase, partial [Nocardiopsis tropica]|nr:serine/threonine-protein kinase [Nocardiopsis tropica]